MSGSIPKVTKIPKTGSETQESIIKQLNEAELILVSIHLGSFFNFSKQLAFNTFKYTKSLLVDCTIPIKTKIESHQKSKQTTSVFRGSHKICS